MGNVKGAGVETSVLMFVEMNAILSAMPTVIKVRFDAQSLGVECAFTTASDLLVDVVKRLGHIKGGTNAHRRAVQVARSNLGYVADAVDLLVFVAVLVVVVSLESQFGAACRTLKTTLMEKGKILEGTDSVYLVHRLAAPEAEILVKVHHLLLLLLLTHRQTNR